MRNILHPGTWKRLTCALALAAATVLMTPATPSNAIPYPDQCSWNQVTYITYYSDATYSYATCVDILYPCPYTSRTYNCTGYETPYSRQSCGTCSLN